MNEPTAPSGAQAIAAAQEIESFWRESAPHLPPQLLWAYADEASLAHPGNLGKQALFSLERSLEAADKMRDHLQQTQKQQAAPAPSRAPEQPAGTKPSYATLVEQMRQRRGPRVW